MLDQRDIGSNPELLSKEKSSHDAPLHPDAKMGKGEEIKSMRLGGLVRRMWKDDIWPSDLGVN